MKNFKIEFTEIEIFNGSMVDRTYSTKWMTEEETNNSNYRFKADAKIIKR